MEKIIGIVSEYNPFHAGHAYHIRESGKLAGGDAAVVCVMSGDFVQRGEWAIQPKALRAEAACRGGADLVIELPLPADALYRLLRGLECRVNLIRFHKIPDSPYEPSPAPVMQRFMERLNSHGITCTIRASRGEDIEAACGLLAGKHKDRL